MSFWQLFFKHFGVSSDISSDTSGGMDPFLVKFAKSLGRLLLDYSEGKENVSF